VGAPPGYIGYDEGGQLTEAVRRKPYSVVLLDEIEKAHPDVFNVLLQVLDEGMLTDNKGRKVNFKNTIIIMTSNTGSAIIQQRFEETKGDMDEETQEKTKQEVFEMLKSSMRPEFLNRIDEVIMFKPLDRKNINGIVRLQLQLLSKRLEGQGIELTASREAVEYIAEKGFDPQFGARPVKRLIQKEVLNALSKQLLAGTIEREEPIVMDVFDGKVVFRKPIEEELEKLIS
jgi:ATP-dependent Clp protease ATP-binding subunit ClpB